MIRRLFSIFRRKSEAEPVDLPFIASFVACNGAPSIAEFLAMDPATRAALAREGQRRDAALACMIAKASSGEEGFLEVFSTIDDGAVAEEVVREAALVRLGAKFSARKIGARG
jgi:hypothetical protein